MSGFRVFSFRILSVGLVLTALASVSQAGKVIPAQKPVKDVAVVGLFELMKAKQVDVKLVHKDESAGNLLIENKADKPINFQMPEAFVGVHVLNQGFFGNGNNGSNNPFGNQGGQGSGQGQGGQTTGGGASGGNQTGSGIFSVPPGKIARVPVRSVCLEHGRPTPSSRMEYRIFPVERFTKDPALFELLTGIAAGKHSQKVAQAAAWHLASDKSWKQLAAMKFRRLGGLPDIPEFTQNQLAAAKKLAENSQMLAEKRNKLKNDSPESEAVVVRREVSAR